jgi:hypothetical protein
MKKSYLFSEICTSGVLLKSPARITGALPHFSERVFAFDERKRICNI